MHGGVPVTVVSSQTANPERDRAFNVTQHMLQSNRDMHAVLACNDVMVLGAVEAIAATGLQGRCRRSSR
jgi:ABC-type sugar transport system substrate-binding protein